MRLVGGLLCGELGQNGHKHFSFITEENSWHYGFGLAGIFMILGLITFLIGQKSLGRNRIC